MHYSLAALLLAANFFSHAQASPLTDRAVEPTATGQIGVNLPNELGDPSDYVGSIGVDTQYLTLEGTITKWIGVNLDYITEVPTTVTVDSRPVISNIPLEILASTATAKASGLNAGDVTILLSETFRAALETEVKEAAVACGAGAKIRKRQAEFMQCMIRAGQNAAEQEGGALDLITPGTWERFTIDLANDIPREIAQYLQWGGNRFVRNRLRLYVGAAVAAGVGIGIHAANVKVPAKLKFSNGELGDPNPTSTSSSSACDPSATPNADSPVCSDKDCVGEKKFICTEGKNKGCRCTGWTHPVIRGYYDTEFGDEQQKFLADILNNLPEEGTVPPKCHVNSNGDGFDGKPMAEPSAWCVCTSASNTGVYSTLDSKTSPCALNSMPTKTISISTRPEYTGPVTSCKMTTPTFSSTTIAPYCTCNDNKMHGGPVETTTVEDGKTKTICVAPETDVPSRPSPEDAVKCKPKEVPDAFGGPNCDGCNDTHPLSQKSAYKAAVREFCRSERTAEQGYKDPQKWSATLDVFIDRGQEDPDTKLPPICARYNQMWEHSTDWPDSEKYCKAKGTWDGNSVFRVTVIPKEDQSDCKDIADYKLPKGDKCEEKLNAIVDKCIAGEKDDETGGYYYDSNSNGCWEWWIWSKTDINLKE